MKFAKTILKTFLVLGVSGMLVVGCKKNNTNDIDADVRPAEDQSMADIAFTDVQQIADEAATTGSLSSFREPGGISGVCATITRDTISTPRRVTIDFGAANCLCTDGKNRRGKVIVSYTGRYKDAGTVINIGFDNYFVNDNQVTGTKTVTNQGRNASGNLVWAINVNGQVILANNGGTISWTSQRSREMVAGENTPAWSDDVYRISGNGSITSSNGKSCTFNITTPLRKEIGCKWFVSGIVDITPGGKATRTLNFGTSGCDNQATVTILGSTFNITLR
jgi:PBP1b-binding outer membrane lipoprotein LpoB